jgi:hypothetical protein
MEEARWVLNVLYDALAGQVSNCYHAQVPPGCSVACWVDGSLSAKLFFH